MVNLNLPRIPPLFQEIIQHDLTNPRDLPVVSLEDYKKWHRRRRELTAAAEKQYGHSSKGDNHA